MEWLTKEYVQQEAEKNLHAALDVTIEHWTQLCEATEEELKAMSDDMISSRFCGLCMYFRTTETAFTCVSCLLNRAGHKCGDSGSLWMNAYHALTELTIYQGTLKNFRRKAKRVLKAIKSLKKCNRHLFKCKGK
jgi:hypothetical protein